MLGCMRGATHPSVSWKLTFTFLADPRSSETQTKWDINWFLQPIKDGCCLFLWSNAAILVLYLMFMFTTLLCQYIWVFISSSGQRSRIFPLSSFFIHCQCYCRSICSEQKTLKSRCHLLWLIFPCLPFVGKNVLLSSRAQAPIVIISVCDTEYLHHSEHTCYWSEEIWMQDSPKKIS